MAMLDTVPDYVHNLKNYFRFTWEEIVGFIVTSVFASFILTFNDWGDETFDAMSGLESLATMFFFLFIVFVATTLICKLLALRFGYELFFEPHLIGLMLGLVIAVASAGYLPIFIPGGFRMKKPWRLYVGHWRGYQRFYEVSLICSTFIIMMLLYALVLNAIYLATGSALVLKFIGAVLLVAIFALIPVPNVALEYGGRVLDFFRYLKGTTFGLQIFVDGRTWYVAFVPFVILSAILGYSVSAAGGNISLIMYFFVLVLGLLVMWVYKTYLEKIDPGHR